MKLPKTLGEAADLLYKTKEKRLAAQKVVEQLADEETALKEHIIKTLPKSKASGVAGKVARVSTYNEEVNQVEDWDKFYTYVHKHKAYELLQRRVSNQAVEERLEAGEKLPGFKKFTIVKVSLNKL